MKLTRALSAICMVLLSSALLAHGNEPRSAELQVEGGKVVIDYVSPDLKGRDVEALLKQPNANPWRMGADKPTTLKTPVALQFGDTVLEPGTYVLRAGWDDSGQWWLQAVDSNKEVVGKVRLEKTMAKPADDHLSIKLGGSSEAAMVEVTWGTQTLKGQFSVAE